MKKFNVIISILLTVTLLLGVSVMPSAASGKADSVPAWAVDDDPDAAIVSTGAGQLPDTYDLRSEGVVTPVKNQGAWQTCWTFGSIAAAETAILSSEGATYEETGLDLSERHLAYFGLDHITEEIDSTQVGEGIYTVGEDEDMNARMNTGGWTVLATTLFSQGLGPVPEEKFPYRGVNESGGSTYDAEHGWYSQDDNWTIPVMNEEYNYPNRLLTWSYILKDGNVLPDYWPKEDDLKEGSPSEEGIEAIKKELLNGRGVAIAYNATDRYSHSDDEKGLCFASYCSELAHANHEVCIIGWDDNYSASNFTHTKDTLGNPLADVFGDPYSEEDAAALTTPPADGAWIVKNSYGSETDWVVDDLGNVIGKSNFGIKNDKGEATGYFYLSYYDKTIEGTESLNFTNNLDWGQEFDTCQYDYMPALRGFYTEKSGAPMSSANIFSAEMSGRLNSVSTSTAAENTRVTLAVYLLDDDAENPTDGEMVYRGSQNFEYSGFHRVDLDKTVMLEKGQKFSVVSTASVVNTEGKREYNVSANEGISQEFVKETHGYKYTKAVVNEGESFLYRDGQWTDWSEYIQKIQIDPHDKYGYISHYFIDFYPIDNFSIKAYVVSVGGEDETVILGDADSDGEVTILDATAIQRWLADLSAATFVEKAADTDGDGEVTILDATEIQRWLADMPANERIGKAIEENDEVLR